MDKHPWTQETIAKMAKKVDTSKALEALLLLKQTPVKETRETALAIKRINRGK